MNDGRNFFDQPVKNYLKIYDNIQKIAVGQGDDCITGCLLHGFLYKQLHFGVNVRVA